MVSWKGICDLIIQLIHANFSGLVLYILHTTRTVQKIKQHSNYVACRNCEHIILDSMTSSSHYNAPAK